MRQLTTPVRLAELAVTVLVLTASAGCMSVSDNGGRPKPSAPAGQHGEGARSGGGKGAPEAYRGRTGKHDPKEPEGASGTPSPSGSAAAPGAATPPVGAPPKPVGPGPARPSRGPSQPPPSPSRPAPTPPPPSPTPPAPTPDPSPSTTPGADTHNSALRRSGAAVEKEPTASPQVGPV
ncbi:hypothetical protein [Streptomyces sp. NPDC050485]|uniref:hypothetical protein n=1 Tax=Streptomyces sp. NPDC050485 TaxID=3365617 RepID=UPI0037B9EFDC